MSPLLLSRTRLGRGGSRWRSLDDDDAVLVAHPLCSAARAVTVPGCQCRAGRSPQTAPPDERSMLTLPSSSSSSSQLRPHPLPPCRHLRPLSPRRHLQHPSPHRLSDPRTARSRDSTRARRRSSRPSPRSPYRLARPPPPSRAAHAQARCGPWRPSRRSTRQARRPAPRAARRARAGLAVRA